MPTTPSDPNPKPIHFPYTFTAETSAALSAMTEAERQSLYDAYIADNTALLDADATAASGGGEPSDADVTVSQLAAMIATLSASASTGELAAALGVPVLAMSVDTSFAAAGSLSLNVLRSIEAAAAAISPPASPGSSGGGIIGGGGSGTPTGTHTDPSTDPSSDPSSGGTFGGGGSGEGTHALK